MINIIDNWQNAARNCFLALAIGLIILGVTGCVDQIVSDRVENRIKERLPELIGPAESYHVEVHGSLNQMIRGWIREVEIRGKGVKVMPNLCMDTLDINLSDVAADPDTLEIKTIGEIGFEALISEQRINDYLAYTRKDGLKVKLLDGKMITKSRPKVLGVSANIQVIGYLVPDGRKLNFRIQRFEVAGIRTPKVAVHTLENRINPVLDMKTTQFSTELKTAAITPDGIRLTGDAKLVGVGSIAAVAR